MSGISRLLESGTKCVAALLLFGGLALGAQTYPAAGLVMKVNADRNEVVVSMREIPGYMEAMVMPLSLRHRRDLRELRPGMMVDFTLQLVENSAFAENLRVRPFENLENDPQAACRLAIIENAMGPKTPSATQIAIGEHVRDFSLTDQNRRVVPLSQFSGKVIAMTFVYTRCPLPNFCLRLSGNFGQVQRRFNKQMGRDLILLSVTLDPANDQPDALSKYASIWKANGDSWHFLTGPPSAIKEVAGMFGVVFNQDEGTMTHSLHTVLIDRQGNLRANLEGNEFTGKQLGDLIEAELDRGPDLANSERPNIARGASVSSTFFALPR